MAGNLFIHANGGGRVIGVTGSVASDCFIEADGSEVRGASFISCLSSIGSDSIVDNSHVFSSEIERSVVVNSHIADALVDQAALDGVVVRGAQGHTASVKNVILSGGVVVEQCKIENVELSGGHLLHVDWTRTPRNYLLQGQSGVHLAITECKEGHGHCGCKCRPYAEWIEKKELLRRLFVKKRGWDGYEPDLIHDLFDQWRK